MKNMQKYSLYLPEWMLVKLAALSELTGAPVSEIIRRAIIDYFDKGGKKC